MCKLTKVQFVGYIDVIQHYRTYIAQSSNNGVIYLQVTTVPGELQFLCLMQ